MSLMAYWLRHLKNVAYQGPVRRTLEDPFFRDPMKFFKQVTAPLEKDHGIKGIYSESEVKVDGKKVEVHLDLQNFSPEQIQVKTVGNEIMIEGKKEIKREDGWTRSHFERRFLLPEGFPPERVECHLDKGKLKLIAFRSEPVQERAIPIQDKSSAAQEKEGDKESMAGIEFLLFLILIGLH